MSRKRADLAAIFVLIFGMMMLAQRFTDDWYWMLLAAGGAGAASICLVERAFRQLGRHKKSVVESA